MAVREAAVVQHLQEQVEDVRMRLLDLVQENDRELLAPHGLRELAAVLEADVAGGRADEARDGELLHVLRHVEPHHRVLVVEELLREGLGELGLSDARRAEEQERADRTLAVLDAGARADDRVGDGVDGPVLADDALVERVREAHELFALALDELRHGDAAPARDDLRDLVRRHLLAQERRARVRAQVVLMHLELLLEFGDVAVLEPRRLVEVAFALGALVAVLRVLQARADAAHVLERTLLLLPLRRHLVGLRLEVLELVLQLDEPLLRVLVLLLLERDLLDFETAHVPRDLVELLRAGVHLRADAGARLVEEIDGLVRQEAVLDVARAERDGRDERLVADVHVVVLLEALLDAAQNRDRILLARRIDLHGLEAALQGGVLLHVLAVLVEGRRADAVELAAREHRLEHVARVARPLGLAGADDRVDLVDEEDDLPLRLLDLLEDGLQPLLELAPVRRAGHEGRHVEREDHAVAQPLRDVAAHDALREALDDGRLADARLADEDGVVLRLARQDAHDVANLRVAADHGIELARLRERRQVRAVLLKAVLRVFRRIETCIHI